MKTSPNALISSSKDESVDFGARELTIATPRRMSRFLKSFFDERVENHALIQNTFLLLQLVPEQWRTILFYGEVPTGARFVQCMLVLMSEVEMPKTVGLFGKSTFTFKKSPKSPKKKVLFRKSTFTFTSV